MSPEPESRPELDPTIDARESGAELPLSSPPSLAIHRLVLAGRYEILGLLGVGGMGAVYRVRDRSLDELVALKMLRSEHGTTPTLVARFRDEVRLARKVTHRNVARTFDLGEHEGTSFLTMELLEGRSLGARLDQSGAVPVPEAVAIALDVAAGLEAAHAAGVIHCDLKPDNVFLAADGRAVVTDFGIARARLSAQAAEARTFVGTPAYAAPEQITGPAEIDGRTDLYALGEVLFEMLTGVPPWQADTAEELLGLRLVSPPPDPRKHRPDLPESLAAIVTKLTALRREDRYATAGEVMAALRATGSGSHAGPREPGSTPPIPKAFLRSERTLAVLPFASRDVADYVAGGLVDDLVDALSMTRGLLVRPAGAVRGSPAARRSSLETGKELGVQVVIEGNVRRTGAALAVHVRATSVEDGFQIWADRWVRPAGEVLRVADDAAMAIAAALTGQLDLPDRGALKPEAADLVLRARAAFQNTYFTLTEAPDAATLFDQAVEAAPEDARVVAAAAMAHARVAWAHGDLADAARDRAQELADRAIAIAPRLAEPWIALAALRSDACDLVGAVGAARKALQFAPHSATARDLIGRALLESNALDDAIELLRSAVDLDPSTDRPRWELVRALAYRGDHDEAWALTNRPLASEADRPMRRWIRARMALWSRDPEMARAIAGDGPFGQSRMDRAVARIHAVVATGRFDDGVASEQLANWDDPTRRIRLISRQSYVEMQAFAGAPVATTLDTVKRIVDDGLTDLAWLDRCPLLAAARTDPRWEGVRSRVARNAQRVVDAYRR